MSATSMMNRVGDIDTSFKRLPPIYGYRGEELVSLEKALEPVEPYIDELSFYIKTAKKHCHFPSEHGLSRDQSAAVYIYTMEWSGQTLYRVLNKALLSENRRALTIWFPYLKLFDTALDMLPTVKEVVWRGVSLDIGKNFTKNQMITWWSFNSCSSSVDVIKGFLGNNTNSTVFLIEAVYGKKVSGYTGFENEDEVILRMGTEFRVKSNALAHSNSSYVVHLIETNGNDDQDVASGMNQLHVNVNAASNNSSKSVTTTTVLSKPPIYRDKGLEQMIDKKKNRSKVSFLLKGLTDDDIEIVTYYLSRDNTVSTDEFVYVLRKKREVTTSLLYYKTIPYKVLS